MGFGNLLQFFEAASDHAKLDPETLQEAGEDAPVHAAFHRTIVICGIIGAIVGLILGLIGAVAMYKHPSHPGPVRTDDFYMIILSPFLMIAGGILGGACWACTFAPTAFLEGPIGSRWMKLIGTTSPTIGRCVSVMVALIVTGWFIFEPICIALGKI
jgi:hypothetical protein